MNGGLTECGRCDGDPCCCKEIAEKKRLQKVSEGRVVIKNLWRAIIHLPTWKIEIIKWFWPDFIQVIKDVLDYHRSN